MIRVLGLGFKIGIRDLMVPYCWPRLFVNNGVRTFEKSGMQMAERFYGHKQSPREHWHNPEQNSAHNFHDLAFCLLETGGKKDRSLFQRLSPIPNHKTCQRYAKELFKHTFKDPEL